MAGPRHVASGYRPPWWLRGGHVQTLAAALIRPPRPALRRERIDTPDGDFVDFDWAGETASPTVLALFHGLEGSSDSHYARTLVAGALARGWQAVVPHFRGCSGEANRLARAYHSGDTPELDWMLGRVRAARPQARLVAAGVSLGGNVLLKWLGEQGEAARPRVARAAAVSAPIDLGAAGRTLDRGFNRHVYVRSFLATMKRKALDKARRHAGAFDAARVRRATTLYEFDDAMTAPLHGYAGVEDYWRRASSAPQLAGIGVPTLLLNALDDPFLPAAALAAAEAASGFVELETPAHGGHAGFLTGLSPSRGRWLADRVLDFLARP